MRAGKLIATALAFSISSVNGYDEDFCDEPGVTSSLYSTDTAILTTSVAPIPDASATASLSWDAETSLADTTTPSSWATEAQELQTTYSPESATSNTPTIKETPCSSTPDLQDAPYTTQPTPSSSAQQPDPTTSVITTTVTTHLTMSTKIVLASSGSVPSAIASPSARRARRRCNGAAAGGDDGDGSESVSAQPYTPSITTTATAQEKTPTPEASPEATTLNIVSSTATVKRVTLVSSVLKATPTVSATAAVHRSGAGRTLQPPGLVGTVPGAGLGVAMMAMLLL